MLELDEHGDLRGSIHRSAIPDMHELCSRLS
jgi:hypothetical protein